MVDKDCVSYACEDEFDLDNSFGSQCGFNFGNIVFHLNYFIVSDLIDLPVHILDFDKKLIPISAISLTSRRTIILFLKHAIHLATQIFNRI